MFLFFNIIYFFYPLYIMNEEQIFMTTKKPSNKNYQQQKQNILILNIRNVGGSNCSHCRPKFNFWSWGWSDCSHCRPSSTSDPGGGGPTAVTGYGLCNGTRMIVLTLGQRVVEVEISSGEISRGNLILIPHITIAPSDTELPFTLKHHQFPLWPCFAMSTNKAQGQTLQFVGIYLPDHVFTHGQLYVAFSWVTDPSDLAVCLNNPDGFTRNIVFQEVLWLYMYTLSRMMRSLCPPDILCKAWVGHY